ncbi:WbqC family protein [Sulfuricurvum sp.]|uniref:WbqC family protein n=1 Tax=Sulfuricurvum sp. TaxID=2025608 RepID=UPI0035615D31
MKKIAILQSNYIPWKGYFDLINMVDEFVFYDTAQYTKNDWRNRNKIKTQNGISWLTIPVKQESLAQTIKSTKIISNNWAQKHWKSIVQNYSKAKYFKQYKDIFEEIYIGCQEEYLSEINYKFIRTVNDILMIKTKIRFSNEFNLLEGQSERLIGICKDCKGDIYLSGPAAKNYLDESLFERENIKVEWMDYSGYPEYNQLFPPFEHGVSILDLIFNEGENATKFMKSYTE